jgi:hypothetical protein
VELVSVDWLVFGTWLPGMAPLVVLLLVLLAVLVVVVVRHQTVLRTAEALGAPARLRQVERPG